MDPLRGRLLDNESQQSDHLFLETSTRPPSLSTAAYFNNSCKTYGLPNGWNAFHDRFGRLYYVNWSTKEVKFEHPITNQIDETNHHPSLPKEPPGFDEFTPYYLAFIGPSNPEESHYFEDDETPPQQLIDDPNHVRSSRYWAERSKKAAAQNTTQKLDGVPNRTLDTFPKRTPCLRGCIDIIKTHKVLTLLTFIIWISLCGVGYWFISQGLHKAPSFKHEHLLGPLALVVLAISYAIYFILGVLPAFGSSLPCIKNTWTGFLVSYDILTPLRRRVNTDYISIYDAIARIESITKQIPTLDVMAENYHLRYDDDFCAIHDHGNTSDHLTLTINEADQTTKNNILDHDVRVSRRIRRVVPIKQFKDISTPLREIQNCVLNDTTSESFDVLTIRYRKRFEVDPIQVHVLDALLSEYYYTTYLNDSRTNVSMNYSIGDDCERWCDIEYSDVIFNHSKNQSCCWSIFFKYHFIFLLLLCFGWYLPLLIVWRCGAIDFTYHNVKYLVVDSFEEPPVGSQTDKNGVITYPDPTNDKRVKYFMRDQILFNTGHRSKKRGKRPPHLRSFVTPNTLLEEAKVELILPNNNSTTTTTSSGPRQTILQLSSSRTGTGTRAAPPPPPRQSIIQKNDDNNNKNLNPTPHPSSTATSEITLNTAVTATRQRPAAFKRLNGSAE